VSTPAEDRREARAGAGTERGRLRRFTPLAVVVAVAVLVLTMGWHRELSLENLVRHRAALDDFVAGHMPTALAAFVAIYIAVVTLSIPGAGLLTITGGILFGILWGGLASVFGATIGATAIFLIARTAFGEHLVRRAGPLAARLAEGFRQDAFSYLLFLRLIPAFPFFVINLVAALAGLRLAPFVAATALGIVPAAFAFAFVGAGLDSVIAAQEVTYRTCLAAGGADCRLDFDLKTAFTPQLIAAMVALGVVALIPVAVKRLRAGRTASSSG
jgi:uncharacterized membrane protein YdjX (TVP38/TMEM64 family)